MNKYIVKIDGMKCGMCEMHVEEAIRKYIKAKKIKASHFKNELMIISLDNIKEEDIKKILDPLGYIVLSFNHEMAKKSLFGWR